MITQTADRLVLFLEEKEKGTIKYLIPVHINKMKCETYFWSWSSDYGDWVRGERI